MSSAVTVHGIAVHHKGNHVAVFILIVVAVITFISQKIKPPEFVFLSYYMKQIPKVLISICKIALCVCFIPVFTLYFYSEILIRRVNGKLCFG